MHTLDDGRQPSGTLGVPEHGKFYWVRYVGGLPRLAAKLTIARFSAAPFNQSLRHGRWDVVANVEGFRFSDFSILAGPIEPPESV